MVEDGDDDYVTMSDFGWKEKEFFDGPPTKKRRSSVESVDISSSDSEGSDDESSLPDVLGVDGGGGGESQDLHLQLEPTQQQVLDDFEKVVIVIDDSDIDESGSESGDEGQEACVESGKKCEKEEVIVIEDSESEEEEEFDWEGYNEERFYSDISSPLEAEEEDEEAEEAYVTVDEVDGCEADNGSEEEEEEEEETGR